MNKLIAKLLLCIGLAVLTPFTNCFAWNAVGHMVIAKIAYEKLTPEARAKVNQMVQDLASEYPDLKTFVDIAPWADQLAASQVGMYAHWHYIDNAFSADSTPVKNINDTDNASWAIGQLERVLQSNQANQYDKARSLAFLVHIVGDVHQPLHAVSRISAAHPDGDLGGNLYPINASLKHSKGRSTSTSNLHLYWDSGLGLFDGSTDINAVTNLANSITALYPPEYFDQKVSSLDQTVWIDESMDLATSFVYTTPENAAPNKDYIARGQEFSKQRVALAGYRLAALLNQLLQ